LLLAPVQAANYRIDSSETTASYETRFLGVLPMSGDFRRSSGTLVYDRATRSGSIEIRIDVASMVSSTAKAESTARGRDFFNVERHPVITFRAATFVFDNDKLRTVEGELTLVGVTRPVSLGISEARCEPTVCRAVGEVVVQRSAFGMKSWSRIVSDDVTIRISLVARAEATETTTPPAAEQVAPVAN
jgi:polyisoprenoid-binding protein YceI